MAQEDSTRPKTNGLQYAHVGFLGSFVEAMAQKVTNRSMRAKSEMAGNHPQTMLFNREVANDFRV